MKISDALISETELAARLRLSVTRLARRLRQHASAEAEVSPSQLATLSSVDRLGPRLRPGPRGQRRGDGHGPGWVDHFAADRLVPRGGGRHLDPLAARATIGLPAGLVVDLTGSYTGAILFAISTGLLGFLAIAPLVGGSQAERRRQAAAR